MKEAQPYPMPNAPYYQGFMPPYYNPYYGQMMVGTNPQGFFVRKSKAKPFYPGQSSKPDSKPKQEESNISSDFVETKVQKKEAPVENSNSKEKSREKLPKSIPS